MKPSHYLLESFLQADMIRETKVVGRRRCYLITGAGLLALEEEYRRLMTLTADYRRVTGKGGLSDENEKA